jgi:uncharacterized protein (DUF1697 family)
MALVVFLRGVNVGGYRAFRPSVLAKELRHYDVVNIGAAGTFVVRKPGSRKKFQAELLKRLPFETKVMICHGRDLISLEAANPFGAVRPRPDTVHFVSILSKAGTPRSSAPIALPSARNWLLRVVASKGQFVFGAYRRHMKTIGYLGQLDKIFGAPATTRNWNTIVAIIQILKSEEKKSR